MGWIYLVIAGIFEIGWPLGFKLSQTTGHKFLWIVFAVISMGFSGLFLWHAQKSIPIGTAYAIWTGIGATGTLLIGILFFRDSANMARLFFASLIIIGIIGLKFNAAD
jgi:quaternary ammonium compound-resistance protein SugE